MYRHLYKQKWHHPVMKNRTQAAQMPGGDFLTDPNAGSKRDLPANGVKAN